MSFCRVLYFFILILFIIYSPKSLSMILALYSLFNFYSNCAYIIHFILKTFIRLLILFTVFNILLSKNSLQCASLLAFTLFDLLRFDIYEILLIVYTKKNFIAAI